MTQISIKEQIKQLEDEIEFYTKNKLDYKEDIRKAHALAITSTYFLNGLDKKECQKLRKLICNMTNSRFKIKYFIKKQIENILEKHDNFSNNPSSLEIEETLKHELSKQSAEKDDILIKEWVSQIRLDPADKIKKSIRAIISYSKYIKQDQQKIDKLKEKLQELKKGQIQEIFHVENKEEKKPKTEKQTKTNKIKSKKKKQEEKPSPSSYYEIIRYIINKNEHKTTHNSNPYRYLDAEDKKLLSQHIGIEEYNQVTLFSYIGKNLLEQNTVVNTLKKFKEYDKKMIKTKKIKKPTLEELLEIALIAYNNIPEYLMTEEIRGIKKSDYIRNDIRRRCDPLVYLKSYEKAYNIYKEYYDSLSFKEQKELREEFGINNYEYSELGINSFNILSPESLKEKINNKIKNEMVANFPIYGKPYDYNAVFKIKEETQLMEIKEIVEVYKEIKSAKYQSIAYMANKGEPLPDQSNYFVQLQQNFCNAIYYRKTNNLTKEEKTKINKEKEIYIICTQILGEEPLFMTQKYVEEKPKPKTVMEEAALANERFFNMNKIEQTFNRINGNWRKFEEKLEEMVNTDSKSKQQEIAEELNGMFRR